MSFQTFVTERLAALTAQLNAIGTNAKKIDELPVQSNLDPASKIHVSRGGVSESLEVQKIINAISNNSYNQLISIGEITIVDNVLTIPDGAKWKINNVIYTAISAITISIPYTATGLTRTDILVGNTLGQIVLEQGTETAGIAVRPNIPINTVLVTEINVTDSGIGELTPPITDISKLDRGGYGGTAQTLDNDIKAIKFPNAVLKTGIVNLTGLDLSVDASAFAWRINQVGFLTPNAYTHSLNAAATNKFRYDLLQGNSFGGYSIKSDAESDTVGTPPQSDAGCIALASILIFGATVSGEPVIETPVDGSIYVRKSELDGHKVLSTGANVFVPIPNNGRKLLLLSNVGLASISGFDLVNIIGNTYGDKPYQGKIFKILNNTGHDVVIKHNPSYTSGQMPFMLKNENDLVFPYKEIINVIYNNGVNVDLEEESKSWDPNKVDKATGYSLTKNDLTDLLKTTYDNAVTWISDNGINVISAYDWVTTNGSTILTRLSQLTNVNNTSDVDKPVSTAQATADAVVLASSQTYSDGLITQLINGAPSDANTLKELNDKILAVQSIIGGADPDGNAIVDTVQELLAVFATFPEGVDLVTLLAGKVNTTDVYNALDCVIAGKVADARQLKVLNDLITTANTAISANATAIVLRELSSNKSNDVLDINSTTKFPVWKVITDWAIAKFQNILVSGTNIKTINGNTLLGSGDIIIPGGGGGANSGSFTLKLKGNFLTSIQANTWAGVDFSNASTAFNTPLGTNISTLTLSNITGFFVATSNCKLTKLNVVFNNVGTGGVWSIAIIKFNRTSGAYYYQNLTTNVVTLFNQNMNNGGAINQQQTNISKFTTLNGILDIQINEGDEVALLIKSTVQQSQSYTMFSVTAGFLNI